MKTQNLPSVDVSISSITEISWRCPLCLYFNSHKILGTELPELVICNGCGDKYQTTDKNL